MRVCPSCGNSYPDDANFCPMDATRLPPPVAEAPATVPSMPVATPAVTQPDQPAPVGGRFVLSGVALQTPTGLAQSATDIQTGATVVVKMVAPEVLPTTAMADRALRKLKQLGKVTSERIVRVIDLLLVKKDAEGRQFPILGDNVSVSAGAVILGPIRIGSNSVIGANSVVTRDIPENVIAAGIPAKVLKERWNEEERKL